MTVEHIRHPDIQSFTTEEYEYAVEPKPPLFIPEMFAFCRTHIGGNMIVGGHLSPTERHVWIYEVDVDRPWAFSYPRFYFKSLSHATLFKLRFG